jgi:hypothetical protein
MCGRPSDTAAQVQTDLDIQATELDDKVIRYRYEYGDDLVSVRFQGKTRELVYIEAARLAPECARIRSQAGRADGHLLCVLEQELGVRTHDPVVVDVGRTADGLGGVLLRLNVPALQVVNELGEVLTTLPGR